MKDPFNDMPMASDEDLYGDDNCSPNPVMTVGLWIIFLSVTLWLLGMFAASVWSLYSKLVTFLRW